MALEGRRRRAIRPDAAEVPRALSRRALAELVRRRRSRRPVNFRQLCHPKQRAFIEDPSPLILACCSRRAGKTGGIARKLIDVAQRRSGAKCLYLTNTRPQAKRVLWDTLQELNRKLDLGAKFNAVELTMRFPNHSEIILGGCNDQYEIERYRGPAYDIVVIDEAQSIRGFLKYLILDILRPATMDHRGQIFLTGTPNAICAGFFHDAAKGIEPGWSVHGWTLLDNPFLTDPAGWLAEHLQLLGVTNDDPRVRREYFGEWVRDSSSCVYQIGDHNIIAAFPEDWADDWEHVLGVDLGFKDVTAFVVASFSEKCGKIVIRESYSVTPAYFGPNEKLLTPEMLAQEIGQLQGRYDFLDIVIDPGGLGATFIDEIRARFDILAHAAEKNTKKAAIELFNGDLRSGKVVIVEGSNADLIHDAQRYQYDLSKISEARVKAGTIDRMELVVDRQSAPNHILDAATYAFRRCRHYFHNERTAAGPPPAGSLERDAWEERKREERELAASNEERPWWAQPPEERGGFFARIARGFLDVFAPMPALEVA